MCPQHLYRLFVKVTFCLGGSGVHLELQRSQCHPIRNDTELANNSMTLHFIYKKSLLTQIDLVCGFRDITPLQTAAAVSEIAKPSSGGRRQRDATVCLI